MAETGRVHLRRFDGHEMFLADVPAEPGDGRTVAAEMERMAQVAYERGRRDQQELFDQNLRDALDAAKKGFKKEAGRKRT